MKNNTHSRFFLPLAVLLSVYILIFPNETTYYAKKALDLCFGAVIPSLFTFIVLSKILCEYISTVKIPHSLDNLSRKFFHLPPSLLLPCLLGLFCSAPSMSHTIRGIYERGLCSRKEAQRALILSNNCSCAFIFGFVSTLFFDKRSVFVIFASNIISLFIVYYLFCNDNEISENKFLLPTHPHVQTANISRVITGSISSSAVLSVTLCGYIVFFYTLSGIINHHLSGFLSNLNVTEGISKVICTLTSSLFEMTSGCVCSSLTDGYIRILLVCFSTAFTGISVFFQVSSIFEDTDIDTTPYLKAKLLCSLLSPVISVLLLFMIPVDMPTVCILGGKKVGGFSVYHLFWMIFSTVICFVGAAILRYIDKWHKNK